MCADYYDGAGGGGPITPTQNNPGNMSGHATQIHEDVKEIYLGSGGNGADGADAPYPLDINPCAYGQGGIGGMGGGGGGGGGVLNPDLDWSEYSVYGGGGGYGGKGGRGSDGAPGCILVYY